jgi:C-terminal processing protease CtpA/Prc
MAAWHPYKIFTRHKQMKYLNPLIVLFAVLLATLSPLASAGAEDEAAAKAEQAELEARLRADYENALVEAKEHRHAAEASMEKAREQLRVTSEHRASSAEEQTRAQAAQAAQMTEMHEELNHARKQLQETSREIARINREVARERANRGSTSFEFRTSTQPVIGVVLGDATDVGIKVLGVSPDGPSERAGLQQGDVIIALDGRVLAAVEESGNTRNGMRIAMKDIKVNEPVIVSVERGDKTIDLTVVPEVREPLGWHTVTRFPSAPESPGEVISIERIVVPQIDTEALTEQIEQIRIEIAERGELMTTRELVPHGDFEFEFHEMSELGDLALHEANVWFGMPMTRGLKLAEIDPDLGEYFKTDRGVLVLKARTDNDLQLESGDVILQVGDTEVNSPAEFMRALREIESGEELTIDIKRNRKDKTLKTTMPEKQFSYFPPEITTKYNVQISTKTD